MTTTRATISVNGSLYVLAGDVDVEELARQVVAANRVGADFVSLPMAGERSVRVLITPNSQVAIATETPSTPGTATLDARRLPPHFDELT
ncbi:hypothetical protein AB3M83_05655 [Microbacterium sp. 179-B 1A2 NHS]|uniref:hypothetical protein n=1 Tax=Microbacterium sp. 179-B 1A2 NHS TaxID=3142383 RepID=UPI0039A112D4